MKLLSSRYLTLLLLLTVASITASRPVVANGEVGEHVNQLQSNLDNYSKEVNWLLTKVGGIVDTYEKKGVKAANPDAIVDHWEAVDFHAAIETSYIPVYASIWQGLFGVKQGIENKASIAEVRKQQKMLEQALWQGLGAVKLAAQYQQQGLLAKVKTTQDSPKTPGETLDVIKQKLDKVVAKFAEQLPDEATTIVHDTYLNLFEGVEGVLIEQDAELVEDLEKDFNVTLPKSLKNKSSVNDVRQVVDVMKQKLDKAKSMLQQASKNRKDVF
jgi:hypothetical protein